MTVLSYDELRQRGVEKNINKNNNSSVLNEISSFWGLTSANVSDYRVVCLLAPELTIEEICAANQLTRKANVPLIVAHTFGMFGYFITDALDHLYHPTKSSTTSTKSNHNTSRSHEEEEQPHLLRFPPLSAVFDTALTPNIHKLWHILRALWIIQQRERRLPTIEDLPTLSSLTLLPSELLQYVFSLSLLSFKNCQFVSFILYDSFLLLLLILELYFAMWAQN